MADFCEFWFVLKLFAQSGFMIDIERLAREKGHLIDKEIEEVFSGDVPNLHDAVRYHMDTGGKRLRPLLAILTYEALMSKDARSASSAEKDAKILPFAAACEVLHNWFLVHDDIEDGDKVRRDKPAMWVKYGLAHAINAGDYMAQKVYELILNSRKYGVDNEKTMDLLEAMVQTSLRTAEGQAMDINMRSASPSEKDYMDMVIGKTAHYLTVPMVGAAILAGRKELIPKLVEFGMAIGPAFQIADDVLDLTEGKGRGEIGRDIKEGKKSILVIHCLGKCSETEKRELLVILNKKPEETSGEDVLVAKHLFEKYGSTDYARKKADGLKGQAMETAKSVPELNELLVFFADYLVNRKK